MAQGIRLRARNSDFKTIIKLEGADEAIKEIERLMKLYPEAAMYALYEEALSIFSASQEQVPVDDGDLRKSGNITIRRGGRSTGNTIIISYSAPYAVRIHEDTSLDEGRKRRASEAKSGRPSKGAATGKSKFLKDPFEDAMEGMDMRLAVRTARIVKSRRVPLMRNITGRGK
jgi:hypothetical protein